MRVEVLGRLASNAAERLHDPDRALSYLQQIWSRILSTAPPSRRPRPS